MLRAKTSPSYSEALESIAHDQQGSQQVPEGQEAFSQEYARLRHSGLMAAEDEHSAKRKDKGEPKARGAKGERRGKAREARKGEEREITRERLNTKWERGRGCT